MRAADQGWRCGEKKMKKKLTEKTKFCCFFFGFFFFNKKQAQLLETSPSDGQRSLSHLV